MDKTLHELVREGLDNLRASGMRMLPVDESARSVLRGWMRHPGGNTGTESVLSPEPSDAAGASTGASAPSFGSTRVSSTPAPALETVEEKLDFLRRKAENWQPARRLGTLRDTMVFATGNPRAELMLVGEAPGYDEERLREPFVGKAGQKLNQILAAMGLAREAIYISNICKFRPSMPNQGTGNRPPTDEEIASCLPLILAEIRAIVPKCIVCLGGTAAKGLLGAVGSVSSMRGSFHEVQGIPARVTYHPSYLLRNDTLAAKRAVWEDMLAVMERMGMPISDRQQRFFLPNS